MIVVFTLLNWQWDYRDWYGHIHHIDGLVQDCSNSSALAMELLQSCTKPSIWFDCDCYNNQNKQRAPKCISYEIILVQLKCLFFWVKTCHIRHYRVSLYILPVYLNILTFCSFNNFTFDFYFSIIAKSQISYDVKEWKKNNLTVGNRVLFYHLI